jgi:ABC-2 type transport system permease protein
VNLTVLVGIWLALAVVVPAVVKASVDAAIRVPSGAAIILAQREAVNDAWDLPKEATMIPFVERHPEWAAHASVENPFE